jgi:valyl-tRNA synthetase
MESLAKLAIGAVKSKRIKIYPKKWEKSYFNWLKNIKDWCISRQIWWGHKLPIEGSDDVLDTWFSSALWPFAVLGWPQNCKEFSNGICKNPQGDLPEFYPGNIISSAPEIFYLWHVRMIFSGMEFMEGAPFKTIYIHPTILTKEGKRMSKSLGTGIDPLDLIEEYGADATRFGLLWMTGTNQAIRFNNDSVIMGQKFCNKLWNATRFILMNKSIQISADERNRLAKMNLTGADKKILGALDKTIESVNNYLDKFRFDKAAEILYDFFWHDFCDIYLEKSKPYLKKDADIEDKRRTQNVLFYVLLTSLKLLHPFIPFITEEIYQRLPIKNKKEFLMIESWPKSK